MKLEMLNTITKSQTFQTKEFEIENSPFAFQILTKQLYKNPIASIIRELVSNAIDSHTAAGTTNLPITITLPTFLDATFTVDDQGTGLSPEQINNVYTVFFRSDRRQSNEFIGGFGLGAKTPFAYSDQFIITSTYNGTEYQFIALINEKGMPELNLISEASTDRHNGLKVQIPVASTDSWKWTNEAKKILPWMMIHSNIQINCDIPKITPLLKSADWEIIKCEQYSFLNVCIGNVLYTVSHEELFKDKTQYFYGTYGNPGNIVLHFPIGELDVTPNREDLNYSDRTILKLETAYLKARDEIVTTTQSLINQCASYEEACVKYIHLATALYHWRWANGRTLYHPSQPYIEISTIVTLPDHCKPCTNLSWSRRGRSYKIDGNIGKINITSDYTLWYYPPNTKYIKERVKEIPQTSNTNHLLFETNNISKIETAFNRLTTTPVTCTDLTKLVYIPPRKSRNTTPLKSIYGHDIDENYCRPEYYVKFNGNYCAENPKYSRSFLAIVANILSIQTEDIVMLPKSKWSQAKKMGLKNFLDELNYVHNLIKTNAQNLAICKILNEPKYYNLGQFISNFRNNPLIPTELNEEINTTFPIPTASIDQLMSVCWNLNINIPEDKLIKETIQKFYEKYMPIINEKITNPIIVQAYHHYIRGE